MWKFHVLIILQAGQNVTVTNTTTTIITTVITTNNTSNATVPTTSTIPTTTSSRMTTLPSVTWGKNYKHIYRIKTFCNSSRQNVWILFCSEMQMAKNSVYSVISWWHLKPCKRDLQPKMNPYNDRGLVFFMFKKFYLLQSCGWRYVYKFILNLENLILIIQNFWAYK